MRLGTGTVEIIWLRINVDGELKCFVIQQLSQNYPITKTTFLGAHAFH
jgi:hypothetical protein